MNVLVTGSTGFVGSHLCHRLVHRGDRVWAFHRSTSSLSGLEGLPVEHVIGDLTQPDSLREAMHGVEVVFHTAAKLSPAADPGRLSAITVDGTRAVLEAALEAGVRRVVHTSSVAALGIPEAGTMDQPQAEITIIDEHHTWNTRPQVWPYGYAKYQAELEVQKAVLRGLNVVIVNPTFILGPGDLYRRSSSIVMQVAHGHVPMAIPGGLNAVHIEDVIDGHLAALELGCLGERYILGGQNMTHAYLLKTIAEITGVPSPRGMLPAGLVRALSGPLRAARPFLKLPVDGGMLALAGTYFYFDTQKASTTLGLAEPRSIRAAIAEAYTWFRENPDAGD